MGAVALVTTALTTLGRLWVTTEGENDAVTKGWITVWAATAQALVELKLSATLTL